MLNKRFLLTKSRLLGLLLAELILIPWGLLNLAIDSPNLDLLVRLLISIVWLWLPIVVYQKAISISKYRQISMLMICGTYLIASLAGLLWLFLQSTGLERQVSYWFKSESGKVYKVYDIPDRGPSFGAYGCRIVERYDRILPGLLYLKGPIHSGECYERWGRDIDLLPRLKTLEPTPNNPFP